MPSQVTFKADHAKRRLIRRVAGSMPREKITESFLDYFEANLETLDYDLITNYLDYDGQVDWDGLMEYARSISDFRERHGRPIASGAPKLRAAIVSADPMLGMLIRALRQVYRRGEIRDFKSEAEAHAWLDTSPSAEGRSE